MTIAENIKFSLDALVGIVLQASEGVQSFSIDIANNAKPRVKLVF